MVYIPDDDSIISEVGLEHFYRNIETQDLINNNKQNMFTKIIQWFILSSANPEAIALTIKGLVPLLLLVGIDSTNLDVVSNSVVQVIIGIGMAFSAFFTIAGLARKIYYSLK